MATSTATVKTSSLINQYTPQPDGSEVNGTFTCNGTTPVVVADTKITANSSVVITLKTVGGTVGAIPAIKTITAGTGFTVAGTASDTSIYNYKII
jgi:hypothetical protein